MNLYRFGANLYVSRRPKSLEDAKAVQDAGIDTIYTLCRKEPWDTVRHLHPWDLATWYHTPIPDKRKGTPPLAELRVIVKSMLHDLDRGRTVLVHCVEGRNRSVLAACLTQRSRVGLSGLEAYQMATSIRPRCLNNTAFAEWLKGLPRP